MGVSKLFEIFHELLNESCMLNNISKKPPYLDDYFTGRKGFRFLSEFRVYDRSEKKGLGNLSKVCFLFIFFPIHIFPCVRSFVLTQYETLQLFVP